MKTSYSAMLGTDDYSQLPKVTLYPNPVTNELYILSDQKVQNVSIYSLNGVLIKSISGEVASVELSNLNTGKYLVKVATDRGIFTQKIIKK